MNILEKIKDYIPVISLLAIGFAYFDLFFYYKHFNIEINQYISITEILTLFLDKLVIYFIFMLLVFGLLYRFNLEEYNKSNSKLGQVIFEYIFAFALLIFSVSFVLTAKFSDGVNETLFILVFASVIYSFAFFVSKSKNVEKDDSATTHLFLLFITLFLHCFIVFRVVKVKVLSKKEEYKETLYNFTFDKNINTGKDLIYIGRTEKYFFFNNPSCKKSFIIPAEKFIRVDVFKLKTNNSYFIDEHLF